MDHITANSAPFTDTIVVNYMFVNIQYNLVARLFHFQFYSVQFRYTLQFIRAS